jgi:hypothetical protein
MTTRKKPSSPDFDKLYKSIDDSFDIEEAKVKILVFGPNLDDDNNGSELRRYIIQRCKDDKFIIVLAEHKEIQEHYLKILGPIHDLCKMEYHLAIEKDKNTDYDLIDGIIILPNSAGSFIELGMFVIKQEIHGKMLILFNNEYENTISDSFIGKGAKLALDNGRRAITRIIDYKDFDNSWTEVSKFLELIRSNKKWSRWIKKQ